MKEIAVRSKEVRHNPTADGSGIVHHIAMVEFTEPYAVYPAAPGDDASDKQWEDWQERIDNFDAQDDVEIARGKYERAAIDAFANDGVVITDLRDDIGFDWRDASTLWIHYDTRESK